MAVLQPRFGVWDYVVVVIVLIISSTIGLYYRFSGGKQKTMKEYLLADKNMSTAPVAFSLMASFMSAIALLGVSSESYVYGGQFMVINLMYTIFTPVAAYLYLPVFFKLQATSAYEYLELRFGKTARLATSLCYSFQVSLYMGIVLYAPALALEALTGIPTLFAILGIGAVCTFYSTLGGIKAVLMTDVFQSLLMFISAISVIIYQWVDSGSLIETWRIAAEGNRTTFTDFNPDPTVRHTWFTLIFGGAVTFLGLYATNQIQIQRYLTVKDVKMAQKAFWWSLPILVSLNLLTAFAGFSIYARYRNCDPYDAKYVNNFDQLMPYYVIDTMGHIPGLPGLFVAGIFSASLSTISGALNSLAAVTTEDYYRPIHRLIFKKELSDKTASVQTKLFSLLYGIICMVVAFLAQFLGGLLQAALTVNGALGGPILGIFTLGMFSTIPNEAGAVSGLVFGLAFSLWMSFGKKPPVPALPRSTSDCENVAFINNTIVAPITEDEEYLWIHRVSYLYIGLFGLLTTLLVGLIVSLATRKFFSQPIEDYDPNLFTPFLESRLRKKRETRASHENLPPRSSI